MYWVTEMSLDCVRRRGAEIKGTLPRSRSLILCPSHRLRSYHNSYSRNMPIRPPQDNLGKPEREGYFKFLSLPDGGRVHPMALPLLSCVWTRDWRCQLPHLQNESQLFSLSRLVLFLRYKSLAALSSSAGPPYFSPNSLHGTPPAFSFSPLQEQRPSFFSWQPFSFVALPCVLYQGSIKRGWRTSFHSFTDCLSQLTPKVAASTGL